MTGRYRFRPGLAAAAIAFVACACASDPAASNHGAPHSAANQDSASSGRPDGSTRRAAAGPEPSARPVRATQTGLASWYGEPFHGRVTASGEVFDKTELTAAHPDWPLRSLARVTRLDTGAAVLVRVNDRGPFVEGRIIDLSRAAAGALGFLDDGLAEVRVERLGPADPSERAARSRIPPRD